MEAKPGPLTLRARAFAWCVVAAGLMVLVQSLDQLRLGGIDAFWLVLTGMGAVSGLAVLRVHRLAANFSVGQTFSFAALFLFGPAAAAVTSAVESIGCNVRLRDSRPVQHLFNVAAPALAIWLTGTLLFGVLGLPLPGARPPVAIVVGQIAGGALLAFLFETGLFATVLALQQEAPLTGVWRRLTGLWLNPAVGAYAGFLVARFRADLDSSILLLALPIPLLLYYGFRSWLGRLDDQVDHLDRANRAFRAVVRSFATAVDARDEVTHGHIVRVQAYGRALAARVGVTDHTNLEALDVAALLHDIGKIGIPDEILNKPGKLTPAEYEVMKTHVDIGTRILAGIEFPYPAVPIVRSHHENWDGSGYPDGLAGESIPIGARILMIVDCFDALTSDRPYRPRMSVSDAVDILRARRGTMYESTLVDAFIELVPSLDAIAASRAAPAPIGSAPDRSRAAPLGSPGAASRAS